MKDLLETFSAVVSFVCVMALVFIFKGEPSLWDVWHQRAMGASVCEVAKP